jgi:type IV pilus assembly protein PilE
MVELALTLVVLGVLTAIALPSYQGSVRKGRRAEAFSALALVQQSQERWRGNNSSYTTVLPNTAAASAPADGLGVSSGTSSGLYTISLPDGSATATGYTVLATAVGGTSQAKDGDCKVLGVRVASGVIQYGSGAAAIDWAAAEPDAGKCWAR